MEEKKIKFTNEDLLKAMGLEVGDLVRVTTTEEIRIFQVTGEYEIRNIRTGNSWNVGLLMGEDKSYEVIKQLGIYGNARCQIQIDCRNCPLKFFTHEESNNRGLRIGEVWNKLTQYWAPDFIMKSNGFTKEMQKNVEQRLDQYIVDEKLRRLVEQDEEQIEEGEK